MLLNQKRGNLVQNGGFEQGLASWLGADNVGLSSPLCHQGLIAAAMGKPDNTALASMLQDVPVLPGRVYRLELSVAGAEAVNPADLVVDVHWVLPCAEIQPALGCGPLLIHGQTTGPASVNAWKTAVVFTETAPLGADSARICLTKCGGDAACNYLLVDDVIFVERD